MPSCETIVDCTVVVDTCAASPHRAVHRLVAVSTGLGAIRQWSENCNLQEMFRRVISTILLSAALGEEWEMTNWEAIVHEHGPSVYRTAWRILRHSEDCEDVFQDVFVEAHRLYMAGKVAHWRTFLCRLTTFRALDRLRQRKPTTSLDDLPLLDPAPSAEQILSDKEELMLLRETVAELPIRQAAVFCMAHFDELSRSEIAEILEISVNAVAVALCKAREAVRGIFENTKKDNSL